MAPEVGQAVLYADLGLAVIGAVAGGLRLHRPARPVPAAQVPAAPAAAPAPVG